MSRSGSAKELLGGSQEARIRFGARYAPFFKDLIRQLVDEGEREEALHVLERYRARVLLAMLAERDLRLDQELPPRLAAERSRTHREYDRALAALGELDGSAGQSRRVEELLARLRQLREERSQLAREIRTAAPRLAELETPVPLTAAEVRDLLPPGAALLSFCVLEAETLQFVFPPGTDPGEGGEPRLFRLGIGEAELRRRVEQFRDLLRSPDAGPTSRDALERLAEELYST